MTSTRSTVSIIGLMIACMLLGFAFITHAEEDEATPRERFLEMQENANIKKEEGTAKREAQKALMEEKRGEMEEKKVEMEERRGEVTEKREERKAALQERSQERIANLAANVSNRMEAAIARIQQIVDRFQTRMDTLAENGVDVSAAQVSLNEAQAHLDDATSGIANIDIAIAEVVASESPRDAWKGAREVYATIKANIKASHTSLRSALSLLKEAVVAAKLERGASAAVSNQQNSEDTTEEADEVEAPDETVVEDAA